MRPVGWVLKAGVTCGSYPQRTGELQQVLGSGRSGVCLGKECSGCLAWETGGAGATETRLGTTERVGDRAAGAVRVRRLLMPGPPPAPEGAHRPRADPGFGEICVLGAS